MRHVGVDGCGAGWIAVSKRGGELIYRIVSNVLELTTTFASAELILIDIPIGLPQRNAPERACDRLARARLGPRRSSVFPVPCRDAVHADCVASAREHNRRVLGRSLSGQSWAICSKIAEVDDLLRSGARPTAPIREIHPEVCFWALASGSPMAHNKKKSAGQQERLDLLTRFEPQARQFLERVLNAEPRRRVLADDVLDALAAFVTAQMPSPRLKSLRGDPTVDEVGLPMEMVYAEPTSTAATQARAVVAPRPSL